MKKKLCIAAAVLVFIIPLAAETQTITVLDFQTNNVAESDMKTIVSFLSASIFEIGTYTVIDTAQRDRILTELEFSMSGCSDEACQLELGKMLSAELIVTGDIALVGSRYVLTARMLSTETSATTQTAKGVYADLDELIDDMADFALQLAGVEKEARVAETGEQAAAEPGEPAEKSGEPAAAESEEPPPSLPKETPEEAEPVVETDDEQPPGKPPGGRRILAWSCLGAGLAAAGTGGYLFYPAITYKQNVVDPAYEAYMDETVSDYGTMTAVEYYDSLWSIYSDNMREFRNMILLASGLSAAGLAALTVSVFLFTGPQKIEQPDLAFLVLPGVQCTTLSFRVRF